MAGTLTPLQQLALEHLLQGHTQAETARGLGIDPSRISEWKRNAAFMAALSEARADRRTAAGGKLDAAVPELVAELLLIATGKDEDGAYLAQPHVRLSAINSALDRAGVTRLDLAALAGSDGAGALAVSRLENALDELVASDAEILALVEQHRRGTGG